MPTNHLTPDAQMAREIEHDDKGGRRFMKGVLMAVGCYVVLIVLGVAAVVMLLHTASRLGVIGG